MSATTTTSGSSVDAIVAIKLPHLIGLATGVTGFLVGLLMLFEFKVFTATSSDTVVVAVVGGVTVITVVFLAANAALGGSYLNAVASLTGVTVSAGPITQLPVVQTPANQQVGAVATSTGTPTSTTLVNALSGLTAAQLAALPPTLLATILGVK